MWKLLFDWKELADLGTDLVAYSAIALIGTLFFLIRLLMAVLGFDADTDADGDLSGAGSDASFTLFSLLSILAFFMGAGWMGLAARLEWDLPRATSFFLAMGFGGAMMGTASGLMFGLRKMHHESEFDLETAVGRTARAYVNIPAKGKGVGQVEVDVSGRKKIVTAISSGEKIASFSSVRVLEVRDDDVLVVEPLA